jgi:hypothetical protein
MRARFGTGAGVSVVRSKTLASDDWRAYRPREVAFPQWPTEASVC